MQDFFPSKLPPSDHNLENFKQVYECKSQLSKTKQEQQPIPAN